MLWGTETQKKMHHCLSLSSESLQFMPGNDLQEHHTDFNYLDFSSLEH